MSAVVNLTPFQILNELPYAQGREYVDIHLVKAGVRLVPVGGEESFANKLEQSLN